MLIVDERRGAIGTTPGAFLSTLLDVRVLDDGALRAVIRRLAATRPALGIAPHVRRSPSFAARVLAAPNDPAFADLVADLDTLLSFANAVGVRDGLTRAVRRTPEAPVSARIDALLVAGDGAFAWRRLATSCEIALEVVELGALEPPVVDRVAIASFAAFLRFAQGEGDVDARAALRSKLAPIDPADARTLLAAAGEGADVLDVIEAGTSGGGREFAHALRTIARSYRVPDAGFGDVLDAAARVLAIAPETLAVLARIARDFDAARAFAPAWEASDAIDELAAELDGVAQPAPRAAGEPAAPVPPQPPVPVPTRRSTFSASSLNAFAECERKWYFRYVCAAVEDRGSSASFYGIAFHAALEDFHTTHTRFADADPAAVAAALDFAIAASFDRHRTRFDAPVEFELQKRRARRTGKRYAAWLVERARREPFTVVGCETSADVSLGGHPFVGFIDRLDRNDATGEITVVDYKTGAIATSAGDYLDDVLAFRDFQLPFYYWARTAAGDRVTRLALVPLKDALLDVAPVELTIVTRRAKGARANATAGQIGIDDLERARDRMIELASTLAMPHIAHYRATDDPDACRYCAYHDACRERPAPATERFGR
jgi:RecB family exonuclease